MPRSKQNRNLTRLAKKMQNHLKPEGLAETSFITTARLQGYESDLIHKVAAQYWPHGYSAGRKNGRWCLEG